ncbi:MAG: DUF4349 domain-containing protein [Oscillospiraceae bacterium]|nr:DUF4349 domain-containing protein [Oscillospiraceae bacterium]
MKKLISVLLVLTLALSLCACGGAAMNTAATEAAAPMEKYEEASYDMVMAQSANGFAMDAGASVGPAAQSAPENNPEKIIYSADVTVETTDFEGSIEKLNALVEDYKAWVESSSVNGSDYYSEARGRSVNRSASYTLRVPSASFSTLMSSLSDLGNIPYTYTYTENVSAQYYDAQARLTAYTTQEQRLLEMMEMAETVSDVIAIEEKLTELRYEIESIQTSLNNWDRRVDYSYVYLNIQEVKEYTPEARETYGQKLWREFTDGFKDAVEFALDLVLFLVGSIPAIIVIVIVILLARPVIRKRREKKKEKKEE